MMTIISLIRIPKDLGVDSEMVAFTQTIKITECEKKEELLEFTKNNSEKGSPFNIEIAIEELTLLISGSVLNFENETLQISTRMKSIEPQYICRLLKSGCMPNKEVVDFCEIRIPRLDE